MTRSGKAIVIILCQSLSPATLADVPVLSKDQRHIAPFMTQNWLPTALIFGIPSFNTRLLPVDQPVELTAQLTTANTFVYSVENDEAIFLDGEISILQISTAWRLSEDWQIGLVLPYVHHSNGVLDDIISDWHNLFGLPQDGRQESTNNQFRYAYANRDNESFDFRDETGATGDVRLTLSTALKQNFIAHIEVKLPTGDPDNFTGSGGWDYSMGLGWQDDGSTSPGKISLYGTLGFTYLGTTTITALDYHQKTVLTARGGIHWHTFHWLTLSAQLDSNTKIYHSNVKPLGSNSLQLTFGGHFLLDEGVRLSLSVGEDLNTRVTPDFVVNVAAAYRF